jgi:hypothetical protein
VIACPEPRRAFQERDSPSAAGYTAAATGPHLLRPPSPSAVPFGFLCSSNPAPCPLCRRPPRLGRGGKSLAIAISFTSFRLPALKLSCLSFSYPRPLFSIVCGLFYENTGGGIPLPALHGSHLTSHKSHLSPDFASHKSQATSQVSLSPLESALTRTARFCTTLVQISPLESALTDTPPVTPLESALTKNQGGGAPSPPAIFTSHTRPPPFTRCRLCRRLPRPGRGGKSCSEE